MDKRLSCTFCNGEFYDKSTLNRHVRRYHDKNNYHCNTQTKLNDNDMSVSRQQMCGSEELKADTDKYDYNLIYDLYKIMKMEVPNITFDDAIKSVIKYGADHFNRRQPLTISPTPKAVATRTELPSGESYNDSSHKKSNDKKPKIRQRPQIKWEKL